MAHENSSVIYDRKWIRDLIRELYMANEFTMALLDTMRSKPNTYQGRTEMVSKLLELEEKVPKLEKLADAEKLFRDSIQNIRHSQSACSSVRVDLTGLARDISNSLHLFGSELRLRIYSELQNQ